jgi:hypothetical protein
MFKKDFLVMWFLIGVIIFLAISYLIWGPKTKAEAVVDSCNQEFVYTKTSDYDDSRVNINFENSDYQIDVYAKSGYQVTKVELDVDNDGYGGYHTYATGPVSNLNPNPGNDICCARVTVKKVCPTPTPTSTPTPTPTEEPEEEYYYVCRENSCVKVEGEGESQCEVDEDCFEEEPTPTDEPEEEENKPEGCTGDCSAPAPQCSTTNTTKQPENFHVYRKGDDAILKWWATEGNKVNVYWKDPNASEWQHAMQTENFGNVEIHGLGTRDWTFGIQQVNDCGGGLITVGKIMEVVDGNTNGWVLFK